MLVGVPEGLQYRRAGLKRQIVTLAAEVANHANGEYHGRNGAGTSAGLWDVGQNALDKRECWLQVTHPESPRQHKSRRQIDQNALTFSSMGLIESDPPIGLHGCFEAPSCLPWACACFSSRSAMSLERFCAIDPGSRVPKRF